MPNTVFQVSLGYVDAKGAQARVKYFLSADTDGHAIDLFGSLAGFVSALSNAQLFSAPGIGGELTVSGDYGAVAVYESVTDKAVFSFIDSAGQAHRYTIPAPKTGIFLADGITVNKTQTDVANYISFMLNGADNAFFPSTRGGLQFSSCPGALRTKKFNRRRMTIFTKSANLDEQAE